MGKYDFGLEMTYQNSLLLILEQIKPNSVVLEFGPANGRLTRYLKEELNCKVYLVEIDEVAANEALKYGEDLVVGDIESYEWLDRYRGFQFDYLIFADVLEHLHNPQEALIKSKLLLKEDGSVLLSVPNFAHNAILINLMNHDFQYNPTGLLDNTHIHMFTKNSLEEMMAKTGFYPIKRMATYADTEQIEIPASLAGVCGIEAEFWKNRPYGEIYQYVYEAKKNREFCMETYNYLEAVKEGSYMQIFFLDGIGYGESFSLRRKIVYPLGKQEFIFHNLDEMQNIRIDPMNASGIIRLVKCIGKGVHGEVELPLVQHNAKVVLGQMFYFDMPDPQLIFSVSDLIKELHITIEYIVFGQIDMLNAIFNEVTESLASLKKKLRELEDETDKNSGEKEKELNSLKADQEKKGADIQKLLEDLREKDEQMKILESKFSVSEHAKEMSQYKIAEQLQMINGLKKEKVALEAQRQELCRRIEEIEQVK